MLPDNRHPMSLRFEELAWQGTPLGDVSLRRRHDPALDVDIYEVKLGDEFLMSSLFPVAEIELAHLGLAAVSGDALNVVVGGLGLGYTAEAVLTHDRVAVMTVVDALDAVIDWHRRELLPVSTPIVTDARTRLVHDDFFDLMRRPPASDSLFDAILVDIDHSPRHLLNENSAGFYTVEGIRQAAAHLTPGGAFALWSDDPPDDAYSAVLGDVFGTVDAHVVSFANPLTGGTSANTVYVASAVRR